MIELIVIFILVVILGIFMLKYLNGDYTYKDEVVRMDETGFSIKRTYDSGKIKFIKKKTIF